MNTPKLDRIRFVTRHFNNLQGLRYWVPLGLLTLSVGGTTYFANPRFVILRIALFLGAFLVAFGARRYYRNTFGEVESQPIYPVVTGELPSLSVYNPAGSIQRLAGFRQMPPEVRFLWLPLGLAVILFTALQAISPAFEIETDESLLQPPWEAWNSVYQFSPDVILLPAKDSSGFVPPVLERPVSALALSPYTAKAVGGQLMYALLGVSFLGIWLWREGRRSQSYYLVLGVPLLGLAALGTSLGYLFTPNGGLPPVADLFLPTVTHLWVALLLCGASMILAGLLDHWQLVRVLGMPAMAERR